MSLHHLFCLNPRIADETSASFKLEFNSSDRGHIKALRLQVGEHLAVIDANQDYFEVEIDSIEGDDIWVHIAQHLEAPPDTLPVMLVQGLAKGEKMDTVLRAATELGIAGFYPAAMKRSVVQLDQKKIAKRHARSSQIARSAALQAGRTTIPSVAETQPLSNIIDTWNEQDVVVLFWEEAPLDRDVSVLFDAASSPIDHADRLWIIIGPEGGIAPEEVQALNDSAASIFMLSLGPTILRTETAGIVASALVLNELRTHGKAHLR